MATTVLVKSSGKSGERTGDWIVKVGKGRGGKIVSRHRGKAAAMKRGRREGRKRKKQGAILKVQNTDGNWSTEATYGT